jgi:hypothetical protein
LGDTSFLQTWATYAGGFGAISSDHWLGLDNIYDITTQPTGMELRIDMRVDNKNYTSQYQYFSIGNAVNKYKLSISGGTAGNVCDSLLLNNNVSFTTSDSNNDPTGKVCATKTGGWWYNGCTDAPLTGIYYATPGPLSAAQNPPTISWKCLTGTNYSIGYIEMKVRRALHCASYSK